MSDDNLKHDSSTKERIKTPRMFKVIIFNDDFTPHEFVVDLLKDVFKKDAQTATVLTMQVHTGGSAVVGTYTRDIAETKVVCAIDLARAAGHPLVLEANPES